MFLSLSCVFVVTPNLLRSFLAVARHRNMTRAAGELFLSQPAISRQIRQLEDQVGVLLFDRMGKSLHLTEAGSRLAAEAGELLGRLERIAEVLRGYQKAGKGRLRIGASTTPGHYLLPAILGRFHRAHPGVEIQYAVKNSLGIEVSIVHNELDLGVVGGHLAREDLLMEHIAQDDIVCFCGPNHRLAKLRRVSVPTLCRETWVIREKGSATRELFERWFHAAGGKLDKTIELNSPEGIKAMVMEGIGVSFLSIHAIRDECRRKQLRLLPVTGLRLTRPIFLVMHPDKHLSPDVVAIRELIRHGLRSSGAT